MAEYLFYVEVRPKYACFAVEDRQWVHVVTKNSADVKVIMNLSKSSSEYIR